MGGDAQLSPRSLIWEENSSFLRDFENEVEGRMKVVEFTGKDIQVAIADVERHKRQAATECIEVWDSMKGRLPSFEGFCRMYMEERWKAWVGKGRLN